MASQFGRSCPYRTDPTNAMELTVNRQVCGTPETNQLGVLRVQVCPWRSAIRLAEDVRILLHRSALWRGSPAAPHVSSVSVLAFVAGPISTRQSAALVHCAWHPLSFNLPVAFCLHHGALVPELLLSSPMLANLAFL